MNYTELIKQAEQPVADVTKTDLGNWLDTDTGKKYMTSMAPSEWATYGLGAGLGGLGAYGLYRLLNRKRSTGKALLWTLMGAGLGAGGSHAYLRAFTNPETGLSESERLRISNAYHNDHDFKRLYDQMVETKDLAAANDLVKALHFAGNNWRTGVGMGLGLPAGIVTGNAIANRQINALTDRIQARGVLGAAEKMYEKGYGNLVNKVNPKNIWGDRLVTFTRPKDSALGSNAMRAEINPKATKWMKTKGRFGGGIIGMLVMGLLGQGADRLNESLKRPR